MQRVEEYIRFASSSTACTTEVFETLRSTTQPSSCILWWCTRELCGMRYLVWGNVMYKLYVVNLTLAFIVWIWKLTAGTPSPGNRSRRAHPRLEHDTTTGSLSQAIFDNQGGFSATACPIHHRVSVSGKNSHQSPLAPASFLARFRLRIRLWELMMYSLFFREPRCHHRLFAFMNQCL